jgi:hypothetical protein
MCVMISDDVYLLGGYANLELPIPLSAYLDAMNTTCHAVYKAYQDEAFDDYPLLIGTLAALDGDCAHAERSVSSIVRSMGTPLEYQRQFGQSNIVGVGRKTRPRMRKSRSGLKGRTTTTSMTMSSVPTAGVPNTMVPTP